MLLPKNLRSRPKTAPQAQVELGLAQNVTIVPNSLRQS